MVILLEPPPWLPQSKNGGSPSVATYPMAPIACHMYTTARSNCALVKQPRQVFPIDPTTVYTLTLSIQELIRTFGSPNSSVNYTEHSAMAAALQPIQSPDMSDVHSLQVGSPLFACLARPAKGKCLRPGSTKLRDSGRIGNPERSIPGQLGVLTVLERLEFRCLYGQYRNGFLI